MHNYLYSSFIYTIFSFTVSKHLTAKCAVGVHVDVLVYNSVH